MNIKNHQLIFLFFAIVLNHSSHALFVSQEVKHKKAMHKHYIEAKIEAGFCKKLPCIEQLAADIVVAFAEHAALGRKMPNTIQIFTNTIFSDSEDYKDLKDTFGENVVGKFYNKKDRVKGDCFIWNTNKIFDKHYKWIIADIGSNLFLLAPYESDLEFTKDISEFLTGRRSSHNATQSSNNTAYNKDLKNNNTISNPIETTETTWLGYCGMLFIAVAITTLKTYM